MPCDVVLAGVAGQPSARTTAVSDGMSGDELLEMACLAEKSGMKEMLLRCEHLMIHNFIEVSMSPLCIAWVVHHD